MNNIMQFNFCQSASSRPIQGLQKIFPNGLKSPDRHCYSTKFGRRAATLRLVEVLIEKLWPCLPWKLCSQRPVVPTS